MRYKYVIILLAITALIVVPGIIARIFGASIHLLCTVAVFQLFALSAFVLTSLVSSLALSITPAFDKKWWQVAVNAGSTAIPIGAWFLASLTNPLGWEAAMSV